MFLKKLFTLSFFRNVIKNLFKHFSKDYSRTIIEGFSRNFRICTANFSKHFSANFPKFSRNLLEIFTKDTCSNFVKRCLVLLFVSLSLGGSNSGILPVSFYKNLFRKLSKVLLKFLKKKSERIPLYCFQWLPRYFFRNFFKKTFLEISKYFANTFLQSFRQGLFQAISAEFLQELQNKKVLQEHQNLLYISSKKLFKDLSQEVLRYFFQNFPITTSSNISTCAYRLFS